MSKMEKLMENMISVSERFQPSINIAYDLYNDEKIKDFIPTMSSIEVIEEILYSTEKTSTQRATILIGAYGKGKSHLVLVILSLLMRKESILFEKVLQKINKIDPELHEFTSSFISSNKRFFPILIRGNSGNLTQSFLSSIHFTLKHEGFEDLIPETNYKSALRQIELWKVNYPETFLSFSKKIDMQVSKFLLELEEYNANAYEMFIQIYPELTSGSEFNPYGDVDVIELYENVSKKLVSKGYDGIYIIYDEFSKYLESSISKASNSDIKLLQDFAEKCVRTDNPQMHLMLICHKDLSNYIDDKLPKDKVDGWRGISGRFKHIRMQNNYSQTYEIITSVIRKEKKQWEEFLLQNKAQFLDTIDLVGKIGLLDTLTQGELNEMIYGCYPLHPMTTFLLPRLSERVAQNERTLFTFLIAKEKNTLNEFLPCIHKEFNLITPDVIFDYFSPLLSSEPTQSELFKINKLSNNVLYKLQEDSLECKIIKLLALIYMIEQFEVLAPTMDVVINTFCMIYNTNVIKQSIDSLIQKESIIYLKRSNGFLKIKESSGVDIELLLSDNVQKVKHSRDVSEILNEINIENYMYPTQYNSDQDITRYFRFKFVSSSDFWECNDWSDYVKNEESDGLVIAILPSGNDDIKKLEKQLLSVNFNYQRIVFILPKSFHEKDQAIFEYSEIIKLLKENEENKILYDELMIYHDDLWDVVSSFIHSFTHPETLKVNFYHDGKHVDNVKRRAHISLLLSQICERVFYKTPKIVNETINRNYLTTIAINSRSKVINGLLSNELQPLLGLSGSGQDISIARSTLVRTGIILDLSNPVINKKNNVINTYCHNLDLLFDEINSFFTIEASDKGGASFSSLYKKITNPEVGFGIKKGVIPIFIAVVLHELKMNIAITHSKTEVKITADVLSSINEFPQEYRVYNEEWSEDKENYILALEDLFMNYVNPIEKSYNKFVYITSAMSKWYLQLPKFAKEQSTHYSKSDEAIRIDPIYKKIINALKNQNINSREFLLSKLPEITGNENSFSRTAESIVQIKFDIDNSLNNLFIYLSESLKEQFACVDRQASLTSVFRDWYDSLSETTKQNLFKNNENVILSLIENSTNDEYNFINKLAKAITQLRIEDWDDSKVSKFLEKVSMFKSNIDDFNIQSTENKSSNTSYELIFANADGIRIPKRFERECYGPIAQILKNEMTSQIEEYGQAITDSEKRQVLIELLEDLC